MKNIDPTQRLNKEDFCEIFEQLPLLDEDRKAIKDIYWQLYQVCVENPEVTPETAWLATRNTFIAKEPQIGKRMQEQNSE